MTFLKDKGKRRCLTVPSTLDSSGEGPSRDRVASLGPMDRATKATLSRINSMGRELRLGLTDKSMSAVLLITITMGKESIPGLTAPTTEATLSRANTTVRARSSCQMDPRILDCSRKVFIMAKEKSNIKTERHSKGPSRKENSMARAKRHTRLAPSSKVTLSTILSLARVVKRGLTALRTRVILTRER